VQGTKKQNGLRKSCVIESEPLTNPYAKKPNNAEGCVTRQMQLFSSKAFKIHWLNLKMSTPSPAALRAALRIYTEVPLPSQSTAASIISEEFTTERAELVEALRDMMKYFANPRREEWLNNIALNEAKAVTEKARAILAKYS
jgi:hypothetical protein